MDLKAAFAHRKAHPDKKLHFHFCEKESDGKPLLAADIKKIPEDKRQRLNAAKKGSCAGTMELSESAGFALRVEADFAITQH